ncbi:hypothetical protein ACFL21_01400 [Patescibacteria group bacterium]
MATFPFFYRNIRFRKLQTDFISLFSFDLLDLISYLNNYNDEFFRIFSRSGGGILLDTTFLSDSENDSTTETIKAGTKTQILEAAEEDETAKQISHDDIVRFFILADFPFSEWSIPSYSKNNGIIRFEMDLSNPYTPDYEKFYRNLRDMGCSIVVDEDIYKHTGLIYLVIKVPFEAILKRNIHLG